MARYNAQGVAQDFSKAREWYESAAEKGELVALAPKGRHEAGKDQRRLAAAGAAHHHHERLLADFAQELADGARRLARAAAAEKEGGVLLPEGVEPAVGADGFPQRIVRQTRDPAFPVVPVILPVTTTDRPFDFLNVLTWVDFSRVGKLSDAPDEFARLLAAVRGMPMPGEAQVRVVCPAKAGMFSRRKACRGKSQEPRSLDSRVAGNQNSEAYRQRLPREDDESPGRNDSERKSGLESA